MKTNTLLCVSGEFLPIIGEALHIPDDRTLRRLSLDKKFPKFHRTGSQRTPAYFYRAEVLAFVTDRLSELRPDVVRDLKNAWGLEPAQPKRKKAKEKDAPKVSNRQVQQ